MDREQARAIGAEVKRALEEIGARYSVSLSLKSTTFDESKIRMSIVGQIAAGNGDLVLSSSDAQSIVYLLAANCSAYSIEDITNGKFRSGLKLFRITGYDSKKRKFPIIVEDQDKKSYKVSPEQLSRMTFVSSTGTSVQDSQNGAGTLPTIETVRTTSGDQSARAIEISNEVIAYYSAGHGFDSCYQYLEESYGEELEESDPLSKLVEAILYKYIRN